MRHGGIVLSSVDSKLVQIIAIIHKMLIMKMVYEISAIWECCSSHTAWAHWSNSFKSSQDNSLPIWCINCVYSKETNTTVTAYMLSVAIVTPILEKSPQNVLKNYRPVSNIFMWSKGYVIGLGLIWSNVIKLTSVLQHSSWW